MRRTAIALALLAVTAPTATASTASRLRALERTVADLQVEVDQARADAAAEHAARVASDDQLAAFRGCFKIMLPVAWEARPDPAPAILVDATIATATMVVPTVDTACLQTP